MTIKAHRLPYQTSENSHFYENERHERKNLPNLGRFTATLRELRSTHQNLIFSSANIPLPFAVETTIYHTTLYWSATGEHVVYADLKSAFDSYGEEKEDFEFMDMSASVKN